MEHVTTMEDVTVMVDSLCWPVSVLMDDVVTNQWSLVMHVVKLAECTDAAAKAAYYSEREVD